MTVWLRGCEPCLSRGSGDREKGRTRRAYVLFVQTWLLSEVAFVVGSQKGLERSSCHLRWINADTATTSTLDHDT